ncbi:zinc finger matrin-type protein 2 isoform X1 [Oncorhynchus mykiss]|nr:zinc finger matrin-type protein 2 isoform X1 [Oncorhynchus mykiss]
MKRHTGLSIRIPQATSATTSTSAATSTPQPTQHSQVSSELVLNVVPVLQQQTVADVILELSPRPRIQEASPRKIKAESATVLTASPHKRFLEDKAKQLLRELRKQKETSDTEESCGATEKGSSRFQNHNKHPKRALLCYRWGLDTVPAVSKSSGGGNSSKNDFRRKWDKDEYEQLAQKRLDEERDKKDGKPAPPVKRELLRHRDYKVDLESKLGKTIVITKTTPQAEMGGYYCNVCDCVVKDSINFLDHINGKKHQRNLGMSMRVERSSLDQVKKRFEVNKKKIEEKQTEYDFEERMKELREEEEKAKAYKKEKQKEKKRKAEEDLFEEDDEMAAVMGFSGFGSSKKGK